MIDKRSGFVLPKMDAPLAATQQMVLTCTIGGRLQRSGSRARQASALWPFSYDPV